VSVRPALVAAIVIGALGACAATPATAATTVGSDCLPIQGEANLSLVQLRSSTPTELTSVPSAGVITRWVVQSPASFPQNLDVLRPTGPENQFTIVSRTAVTLTPPRSSFDARIPVLAGDRIGVSGDFVPYCVLEGSSANRVAFVHSIPAPGVPTQFETDIPFRAPLQAVVEPDADGDGYGDETQDGCPRSASLQTPCPVIELGSKGLAGKGSAVVLVTASSTTKVTVKGKVSGGKLVLKGGSKTVGAGTIVPFKLKFPPSLKAQLASLPPGDSVTLKTTAATADATGAPIRQQLKVKLRGAG
jgi:hypothetical protein